jgi:hypothetical protein
MQYWNLLTIRYCLLVADTESTHDTFSISSCITAPAKLDTRYAGAIVEYITISKHIRCWNKLSDCNKHLNH